MLTHPVPAKLGVNRNLCLCSKQDCAL